MRKEQIFEEEDPMAAYIMKKKKKASGVKGNYKYVKYTLWLLFLFIFVITVGSKVGTQQI